MCSRHSQAPWPLVVAHDFTLPLSYFLSHINLHIRIHQLFTRTHQHALYDIYYNGIMRSIIIDLEQAFHLDSYGWWSGFRISGLYLLPASNPACSIFTLSLIVASRMRCRPQVAQSLEALADVHASCGIYQDAATKYELSAALYHSCSKKTHEERCRRRLEQVLQAHISQI